MTTKKGQNAWFRRLFGALTQREKTAARRFHEDFLHKEPDPQDALGRAYRDVGRYEAGQVLGETRVRQMERDHDNNHNL